MNGWLRLRIPPIPHTLYIHRALYLCFVAVFLLLMVFAVMVLVDMASLVGIGCLLYLAGWRVGLAWFGLGWFYCSGE